jgi:hypothetical protein
MHAGKGMHGVPSVAIDRDVQHKCGKFAATASIMSSDGCHSKGLALQQPPHLDMSYSKDDW